MSIIKKPYEISIWRDKLIYIGKDGNAYDSLYDMSGITTVDYQYYDEERLATIGSDVMTSPARVVNPVFKRNINGTETLTFDMYYQYEDIESGEIVRNPLIDLVIDERKVKLKYENKWYDFIVKKDDEKGRDYKYSYTCTGLAANELGKTGFNVELDTELENNMGTVTELAQEVLRNSDWYCPTDGQEIIDQVNEEALYYIELKSSIVAKKISDNTSFGTINSGSYIYAYYTPYANQVKDYFQFIYVNENGGAAAPDLLEDGVTINCNGTRTYDLYCDNVQWSNDKPNFEESASVSNYRGRRYVKKQLSTYDPTLKQTVLKYRREVELDAETFNKNKTSYYYYEDKLFKQCTPNSVYNNLIDYYKIYYGYTTTEYIDTTTVQNYIYNSTNFAGTSYWSIHGAATNKSIQAKVFPDVKSTNPNLERNGYLVVNFGNSTSTRLVNDGIIQNYSRIDKFEKGEVYRLRVCAGTVNGNNFTRLSTLPFKCIVKKYKLIDVDTPSEDIIYFDSGNATGTLSGDYIYVDMTCSNSATWRELKERAGIFFILKNGNNTDYYIKDIQFFKKVTGKNGVINPDDSIENLPDIRVKTKNYFYDPEVNIGKIAPEDYVYSESDPTLYTALYGTGNKQFEKVRSITAKESNRFNLLQELSETFECWVRFDISHDTTGKINIESFDYYNIVNLTVGTSAEGKYIYDWYTRQYIEQPSGAVVIKGQKYYEKVLRRRQVKRVYFYKEILIENYAGFKYGINLKDNNRTLDSEQIVTKIIVKDNTCEQAENGFCSIARAEDNPIKENFAYNFDYYTSQGLINQSTLNNDLYLQLNGSVGLYPRLSKLNKERNQLIDSAAPLANSISDLSAQYQTALLTYDAAEKELQRMKDPKSGTIYQYTHYKYEDFYNQYKSSGQAVSAYSNEIYYIKVSGINNITTNNGAGTIYYYVVTNDTTPQDNTEYYYISSGHFTELGSNKFREGCIYYERLTNPSYGAETYFETGDNTTRLTFTGTSNPEVYIYGAVRRVDKFGAEDYIDDNFTISTLEKIVTQENNKQDAADKMSHIKDDLDETQAQYDSIQDQLKSIANATDEVEKEFTVKYARYIQEGSWTDDNYMDDDLYYLDALSVLYQSAYPKVSYNFSVIDLSQLEGYEGYKFDIGHKTYVEDTEFFGYQWVNNLRTPAKEQVVVTEATIYLDEVDKNQLKVQNYKSHFEDLFQRITAATQSLEFHSGEYAKAAGVVTATGEISQSVVQRSLANSNYIISNSHDQSVVWDETGIQATNLTDPLQVTRLASGGILVSADGGNSWGVAISGYGINTNYLSAGVIDADNINIMSGAFPTFRWDAKGLRAYGYTANDDGSMRSYDPSKFVNYDRFGIYGINGITNPEFNTIQNVEDNAIFALTWNGLFMRSTHRNGYIRISPTEDIVLKEYGTNGDIVRGKFGIIEVKSGETEDKEVYGLALYDPSGDVTFKSTDEGFLWLATRMDIGIPNRGTQIYLGIGVEATQEEQAIIGSEHGKKVFRVHGDTDEESGTGGESPLDRFTVYEDGFVVSHGNYIEGPLVVTGGGQIGNMSVVGLVDTVGVRITPGNTTFKEDANHQGTPSQVVFGVKSGLPAETLYSWYYGSNPSNLIVVPSSLISGNQVTLNYSDIQNMFSNGVMYLEVIAYTPYSVSPQEFNQNPTQYYIKNGNNYVQCTSSSIYSSSTTYYVRVSDRITLSMIKDGADGSGSVVYTYSIDSSLGKLINPDTTSSTYTIIAGHVYKTIGTSAPQEITDNVSQWVWWRSINNSGNYTEVLEPEAHQDVRDNEIRQTLNGWDNLSLFFTAKIDA